MVVLEAVSSLSRESEQDASTAVTSCPASMSACCTCSGSRVAQHEVTSGFAFWHLFYEGSCHVGIGKTTDCEAGQTKTIADNKRFRHLQFPDFGGAERAPGGLGFSIHLIVLSLALTGSSIPSRILSFLLPGFYLCELH